VSKWDELPITAIPSARVREILSVLNITPDGKDWERIAQALPEYAGASPYPQQREAFTLVDGTLIVLSLDGWNASRNPGNNPSGPTWIMDSDGAASHFDTAHAGCSCERWIQED
jgi:hypothetical protein